MNEWETYSVAHVVITCSVHVFLGPGEELILSNSIVRLAVIEEL